MNNFMYVSISLNTHMWEGSNVDIDLAQLWCNYFHTFILSQQVDLVRIHLLAMERVNQKNRTGMMEYRKKSDFQLQKKKMYDQVVLRIGMYIEKQTSALLQ